MTSDVPSHGAAVFQFGPIASCIGALKSTPFEARYEEIEVSRGPQEAHPDKRVAGTVYRDGAGRERRECSVRGGGDAFELVLISDFEARTAIALDVAAKAATRFTDMGPPRGQPWLGQGGWSFRGPWSFEAAAETRMLEGVACRRAQPVGLPLGSGAEPAAVGEIWVSDEIKYSVLEHVTEPRRDHHWRLFDIRRVEPPSSLFAVPAGYAEVVKSKFDRTTRE